MKKSISLVLLAAALLSLASCSRSTFTTYNMYAMSTVVSVYLPSAAADGREIFSQAEDLVRGLENKTSFTIESSDIAKFNAADAGVRVSDTTAEITALALGVSKATDGAFDITAAALSSLWSITGDDPKVPPENEIAAARAKVDYTKLTLDGTYLSKASPDITVDTGGITKGYALGKTVELLKEKGVPYGMVSFGGNVGVFGVKPSGGNWAVRIKDPYNTEDYIGTMGIADGYISVSGDYERFFMQDGRRYHHIFDTATGYPCDNGVHSVAVYCRDAALGDALSTSLFAMGYERAEQLYRSGEYSFEALFVTDSGIKMTDKMNDIFTEKTK